MKVYFKRAVQIFSIGLILILSVSLAQTAEELENPAPGDWPSYGRNLEMWRYSPLEQINKENVSDLRLAWSRSLGSVFDAQFSPVVYGGILYINAPDKVIALDATNGDLIWEYTAELHENVNALTRDRTRGSVLLYEGKAIHALADGRVVGLDAKTGKELWITQVGNIALGEGLNSGPIFADGKLIIGPSGADIGGSPGRVIAMDTESGEILWTFNTVPQPGEAGFETWEPASAAEWGGGSAWVPGAYDPVNKTVIYGVGQPIPWWAGDDRQGDNLYTSSWVALDAETGALKWYHQVVPNDEWDYDQIATPTIADMTVDGAERRVVILPTTTGFLTLFDAATGEFIKAHLMHPGTNVHTGYTPEGVPIIDDSQRYKTPGEIKHICPLRWVDYEPAAYSPETGLYYRPNNNECLNLGNNPLPADWEPGQNPLDVTVEWLPDSYDRLGALSAINPDTGEVVWEFTTGYGQRSGPVVTASDLVFSGFADRHFRAFDAATGDIVWEQILPAYITANPITYEIDGKQYVAIPAGGAGALVIQNQSDVPPLVTSDVAMFVFALPDATQ